MNISKFFSRATAAGSLLPILFSTSVPAAAEVAITAKPAVAASASTVGSEPASAGVSAPDSSDTGSRDGRSKNETLTQSEQLTRLRARIPILDAEAQIAELEAKIAQAKAMANRDPNGGNQALTQGTPGSAQQAAPQPNRTSEREGKKVGPSSSTPQVTAINGFDGEYRAVLSVQGNNISVGPGDVVSNWRIASITSDTVTLERGREHLVLHQE